MINSILIASIGICIVEAINPCNDAPELHDLPRRYGTYKSDAENIEPYVCDTTAIPPEGNWYKTNGINMPTTPPDLFGCGTKYPIWLNGHLPSVTNEVVVRKACVIGIFSYCQKEISVQIRKCDENSYIYFLYPTSTCEMSYCFGEGQQDTPPNVDIGRIYVVPNKHLELAGNVGYEIYRFKCNFETAKQLDIYYQVMWYINDIFLVLKTVQKENVEEAVLKESDLLHIGINIKCSVRLKFKLDSTPGPLKVSQNQFYGLQLVTDAISFPRNGIGKIKVNITIPLGCTIYNSIPMPCRVVIEMRYPDKNNQNCQINGDFVEDERLCHYSIDNTDWYKIYEIPVAWQDASSNKLTATEYVVQLRVLASNANIWAKHTDIPLIKVRVHDNYVDIRNKQCQIQNSQQVQTFDGRIYVHPLIGVFVLYRDITNPLYEVQQQTETCLGNNICNCGFAIRSGSDVFVINYCGGRKVISFLTCHEKKLEVSKENDLKYIVRMPAGTSIEIRLSSSFPTILTAFINPSVNDWKNSRGLCGYVSYNCPDDFIKPDGNKANIPGVDLMCTSPRIEGAEPFIKSWKVNADDNLFELETNSPLSPSITTLAYCTCQSSDMDGYIGCGGTTIDCSPDFELDNVGAEKCNILLNSRQSKRSLKYSGNTLQKMFDLKEEKLRKKD